MNEQTNKVDEWKENKTLIYACVSMCRHVLTSRTVFLVTLNCERKTVLTKVACVLKGCITLSKMIDNGSAVLPPSVEIW